MKVILDSTSVQHIPGVYTHCQQVLDVITVIVGCYQRLLTKMIIICDVIVDIIMR